MTKKPTDRELGILLRDITGRMPSMPYTDREVRIAKTTYNGADRFELTWRDEANNRRKLWYHNWRHAVAVAKWVNAQFEAAKGKTAFTFNDAADGWIKRCQQRANAKTAGLTPQSLAQKLHNISKVQAAFGPMLLHEIKSRYIDDWLHEQSAKYKSTTLDHRKQAIKHVLEFARQQEMLAVNPLTLDPVKVPGGSRKKRVKIPDRSDMERLRDFLFSPKPYGYSRFKWAYMQVAVVLAASCGMRCGEICGLRWDRINPDPTIGEIEITDVVTGRPKIIVRPYPKTDAGFRKVPTNTYVRQLLFEYGVLYKEEFGKCVGHVVKTERPDALRDFMTTQLLSNHFTELMRAAKIVTPVDPARPPSTRAMKKGDPKFSLHALRHWCASDWMRHAGSIGGIHQVSKWLGHARSSQTLDTYGHCLDDPEGRAKFEMMPSWLGPPVLQIENSPRLAELIPPPAPPAANGSDLEIEGEFTEEPPSPQCPVPMPDYAEGWVKPLLLSLWEHRDIVTALRAVGKTRNQATRELIRLELPPLSEIEKMAWAATIDSDAAEVGSPGAANPVQQTDCPIEIPDIAAAWVKTFVNLLNRGITIEAACRGVRKAPQTITAELRRLKIPDAKHAGSMRELKRRLRAKRTMALYERGYQDSDIARILGGDRDWPQKLRKELLKPNADKTLNHKDKSPLVPKVDSRPEHKKQFKLL